MSGSQDLSSGVRDIFYDTHLTSSKRLKICQKAAIMKKELSTSVDWKAARSQSQSQQIGWENLVKSQKWRLQSYQDRRGIKGFFPSPFEVHLQISKKDPEINQ